MQFPNVFGCCPNSAHHLVRTLYYAVEVRYFSCIRTEPAKRAKKVRINLNYRLRKPQNVWQLCV